MGSSLDPEIAAALAALPAGTFDFDEWTLDTIAERRAARAAQPVPEPPPTTTVSRDEDAGPEHPELRLRVYSPPGAAGPPRPCVYWIHGGGYISGSALTVDPRLNRWSESLGCVVVAVDYRLAPEHRYPVAVEDCYTGLSWTVANARRLGIDPARVVVAGSSAGGGLAAAVALLARDRGGPALAGQLLVYPMLDDRQVTPSSRQEGAAVWGRAANALGWRAYLGPEASRAAANLPGYAAPARAADLTGLPPAFVAIGGADLFRDESIAYAAGLMAAGVRAELHVYPGAPHGFEVIVPSADVSRRFDAELTGALRAALHPPATGAPGLGAADRIAIEELIHGYATAMDTQDWDLLRSCFRPDARTSMDRVGDFDSREDLIALLAPRLKIFAALQHFITNVTIGGDGDAATARCYFVSHHVPVSAAAYSYGGIFEFDFARDTGGWRISAHSVRIFWEAGQPLPAGAEMQ